MIFAFGGMLTAPDSPTAAIILSLMTITALLISEAPVPSIKRAAFKTTTPFPIGGSGRMRPAGAIGVCGNTETHRQTININAAGNSLRFLTGDSFGFIDY